ncbi:MAG: DUF6790 family protein [Xanthobacteraceae bacterium]
MYVVTVVLLLLILPAASVVVEALRVGGTLDIMLLIGKWFVFWGVGVRLFIAGVRQVLQPQFTAESIFEIKDRGAFAIVREVGFGNLAMGTLGLATLAKSGFLVPAAIVGGLYYGLAGAGHILRGGLNLQGWTAMISDLFMFIVLAGFVACRGF